MAYVIIKEQPHVKGWGMDLEIVEGQELFADYIDTVPRIGEEVVIGGELWNVEGVVNTVARNTVTVFVKNNTSQMCASF